MVIVTAPELRGMVRREWRGVSSASLVPLEPPADTSGGSLLPLATSAPLLAAGVVSNECTSPAAAGAAQDMDT